MESRLYAMQLLADTIGIPLDVIDTRIAEGPDDAIVEMTLRIDEDDVEVWAFGILFTLGVLSFADARPRGYSDVDFVEDDEWSLTDMVRHVSFRQGELHMDTDYVRGRAMKTSVSIKNDGTILLRTVHRGTAATRWVTNLQGKPTLASV